MKLMMHAAYGIHPILFILTLLGKTPDVTLSIFFYFLLVRNECSKYFVFRHATNILFSGWYSRMCTE